MRAVAADQPGYVHGESDGPTVRFVITGPSAASVRATIEDLLACVQSAEKAAE